MMKLYAWQKPEGLPVKKFPPIPASPVRSFERSVHFAAVSTVRLLCAGLCAVVVTACSEAALPGPVPAVTVPTVTNVSPDNGPPAGGTLVTITGTNFLNVTGVVIGGNALASLSVVSNTRITGQTSASATSGARDVVVTSSSHGSGSCTGCFTYNPAVTVSGVSPDNGPLAGGTLVTITGTNFLNVTGVVIGGNALASLSVVSNTRITGQTSASATSGARDVVVTSSSYGSGSCTACFIYYLPDPWAATMDAGDHHTCALTSNGAAYCWGENFYGNLGDGSTTRRTSPVAVAGGITFASVTAAGLHTCGLSTGGTAYCWGYNESGQLGDGSTVSRTRPVAVAGGITFASLATGGRYHTCGLTSGGAAYCWGANDYGALGDGSTTFGSYSATPVAVKGGLTFTSLTTGGFHTCGLTSGGAAYCWGEAGDGQTGDGSYTPRGTPVAVLGGITFASLWAGQRHNCGLTSGGTAYCWGDNDWGGVGTAREDHYTPVAVEGGITFASLAPGGWHTCGLTSGGVAYCWGLNRFGQLGNGSTIQPVTPVVAVMGGVTFRSLTAGDMHTCGVTSGGSAYCWGSNLAGQLGNGSETDRTTPGSVSNP